MLLRPAIRTAFLAPLARRAFGDVGVIARLDIATTESFAARKAG